jgi:hypothetical protein
MDARNKGALGNRHISKIIAMPSLLTVAPPDVVQWWSHATNKSAVGFIVGEGTGDDGPIEAIFGKVSGSEE